ncbi:hypothetical protein HK102_011565, partial [Quaeritorhiza haematococci]
IEFVYPASADVSKIKAQLTDWLQHSDKHSTKLYLWLLIFPPVLFLAKFGSLAVIASNILFSYNCFRVNAHYRAMYGAKTVQKCLDLERAKEEAERKAALTITNKRAEGVRRPPEERQRLQKEKEGGVMWNASNELDEKIRTISEEVSKELEEEARSAGIQNARVWRWRPDGDLHDLVIERLEKELKVVELGRTYRRGRLQYFVHNGKER